MANPFVLLVIASGFFVTLSNAWNAAARLNLLVHPILALYLTAHMLWFGGRRLGQLAPDWSRAVWLVTPAALAVVCSVPGIATPNPIRFGAYFVALFLLMGVGMARLAAATRGTTRRLALLNYSGLAAWIVALLSGLTTLTLGLQGGVPYVFRWHQRVAVVFSVLLLAQWGLDALELRGATRNALAVRRWRRFGGAAAAVALLLGATYGYERWRRDPTFTARLSTMPIELRRPHERELYPNPETLNVAALTLTATCVDGCHGELADGFYDSNHNIPFATPHMQRVHALMVSETGEHNAAICFGCHAPVALFDRTLDATALQHRDNMSCTFCHTIRQVGDGRDGELPFYTVAPPERHIELFLIDGRPRQSLDWLSQSAIRMNVLGHARAFSTNVGNANGICVACHERQLLRNSDQPLRQPRCADCHMQPLSDFGERRSVRNHFFPGGNVNVPLLAGRTAAADILREWIDGRFPAQIHGWENRGWDQLAPTAGTAGTGYERANTSWLEKRFRPSRAILLPMALRMGDPPRAGNRASIEIVTANAGVGHNFPATALDLPEVWLQVEIRDRNGRLIHTVGAVSGSEAVPSDAPRLGGKILSAATGLPIQAHRVWQKKSVVVDRVLAPGAHTTDRVEFDVPADVQGPLNVVATWNYRNHAHDFLAWAYGPDVPAVPILRVGSLHAQVAVVAADDPSAD